MSQDEIESFIKDSWCIDLRKNLQDRCADCEARSWLRMLEDLDLDSPDCFERLKDALIWVIENTEWPMR